MAELNLDTAYKLPITIREFHSWSFKMEFFKSNIPITLTGVWKFTIYNGDEIIKEFISNQAGSGLTMSGNTLLFDQNIIQNKIGFGNYYYELRRDENNYSTPVFEGPFYSKPLKR